MQVKLLKATNLQIKTFKEIFAYELFKCFENINFRQLLKTKFAKETFPNFLQSFCSQRSLFLKYWNTIRSTVSQYFLLIVKIKFILSCVYCKI